MHVANCQTRTRIFIIHSHIIFSIPTLWVYATQLRMHTCEALYRVHTQ